MIGPFLNGLGILLGALLGLAVRKPVNAQAQAFFTSALGAFTVFYGLGLVCQNIILHFRAGLKQIAIAVLAIFLGYWLGRLLRLQALSNRLGRHAAALLDVAQKNPPGSPAAGFVAATLLFCAAPLGILGTVADGLENYFYLLLLKAVMDGLAMMSFVKIFRWPVALAALPVFFFFNTLGLGIHLADQLWLTDPALKSSICIAAGFVTCSVALVIFEVRRVELANYLPALAVAPLLTHWLG